MAAVGDFRICPNCATRNKAKWEYCARCGEDLHAVPLGMPEAPLAAAEPDEAAPPATPPWLGLVGVVAALAVIGYAGIRFIHVPPPKRASPELFTMATLVPSPPPGRVAPNTAAERSFQEGLALLAKGDAAGAAPLLARAVADAPENGYYRITYARALLASEGAPAAETIRQFDEAVRLEPGNPDFVADLGRAYDKLGRYEDASRTYARALEMRPGNSEALRLAVSLHSRNGHPEAAVPYLKELAAGNPEDLVIQQDLAVALDKSGNRDAAADAYRDILEKRPQAAVTRGLLAEMMLSDGKSVEAVALLKAGVEANPGAALPHRTLASALERTGSVADAIKEYREYARLNPNAPDAKDMADRAARLEARVAQNPS